MKNNYLKSHWVKDNFAVYTVNELVTWLLNEYDTFPYELLHSISYTTIKNGDIEKTSVSQIY